VIKHESNYSCLWSWNAYQRGNSIASQTHDRDWWATDSLAHYASLFDSERFTRNLEKAYIQMMDIYPEKTGTLG